MLHRFLRIHIYISHVPVQRYFSPGLQLVFCAWCWLCISGLALFCDSAQTGESSFNDLEKKYVFEKIIQEEHGIHCFVTIPTIESKASVLSTLAGCYHGDQYDFIVVKVSYL